MTPSAGARGVPAAVLPCCRLAASVSHLPSPRPSTGHLPLRPTPLLPPGRCTTAAPPASRGAAPRRCWWTGPRAAWCATSPPPSCASWRASSCRAGRGWTFTRSRYGRRLMSSTTGWGVGGGWVGGGGDAAVVHGAGSDVRGPFCSFAPALGRASLVPRSDHFARPISPRPPSPQIYPNLNNGGGRREQRPISGGFPHARALMNLKRMSPSAHPPAYPPAHPPTNQPPPQTVQPTNQPPLYPVPVYRCGFATTQPAYDAAAADVTGALARMDEILAGSRFLAGDRCGWSGP
jgi:hypothetical protein